jgi:sugar lactone lactonase YvrE
LALELAAARTRVLTPQQMLDRLRGRFELLAGGRRGTDPRHRSLRATLEWSYQMLSPALQGFFAQLSVFQGSWTLEAAEAVCNEPKALDHLEQLRECTLVQVAEAGGEMRFHLLETLREYGEEQLAPEERTAVGHRHASYYLALAERVEAELTLADQVAWFARRERDLANLRAALAWLEGTGRIQEALRLGGALRELITSVAGTGSSGYSGDNGPASQAQLNHPLGLAFDAAGNLFIALGNFDARNHRVRRVDAVTGIITTVAGAGQPGFSGDGGKATDAQLNRPFSVVVDGVGNLFIAEVNNHRVRKVTPDGIITTYAGSGPVDILDADRPSVDPQHGGFSGDHGPATGARLNFPTYLAVDSLGNLFISDCHNHRVRKVTPDGIITTVAGTGQPGFSGDSGPAIRAQLHHPLGLALDAAGNLFVADPFNKRVRKVSPDGMITTVAGTGKSGFSGDGGKATDARLGPGGVAVDSAGNLFVADSENYRVRKVSPEGIITTVAGIGRKPYTGDSRRATETGLRGPGGLAIDPLGNLLISDSAFYHKRDGLPDNERVLKIHGVAAPGLVARMPFPQ